MFKVVACVLLAAVVANANVVPSSMLRIVGGESALNENIPWMVSLQHYGSHHCGGSIVNTKTVITAAHCLIGLNRRWIKIRAGSKYASSGGELIPILDYIRHPNFTLGTMDFDLGLIFLQSEITLWQVAKAIPLARYGEEITAGTYATVSGWGFLLPNGPASEVLQYVGVSIIDRDVCNQLLSNKITPRMVCAGVLTGGKDACQQDSGGPLVVNGRLIGVVSWGIGCARPNSPGVYANVAELRPWIDSILIS